MCSMIASTHLLHPSFAWLKGFPSITVNVVLIRSTPCPHHGVKLPVPVKTASGKVRIISFCIFRRLDGRAFAPVENASPSACPDLGYGSCPRIITRTSEGCTSSSGANTFDAGGKMVPVSLNRISWIGSKNGAMMGSHSPSWSVLN